MIPAKRRLAAAIVATGLLVGLVLGLGLVSAPNLDRALARYPGSQPVGDQYLAPDWLHSGGIAVSGAFHTRDGWADVGRWYHDQLGLAAPQTDGLNVRTMCWTLAEDTRQFLVRRATTVTLCAKRAGALVYVRRTLSFAGFPDIPALLFFRPPLRSNAPNPCRP